MSNGHRFQKLRLAALTAGVLAALSAAACGASDEDDASPEEAFVAEYARLLCEGLSTCCVGEGVTIDAGACASSPMVKPPASAVQNFSQARADACLDEVRASSAAGCVGETPTCQTLLPRSDDGSGAPATGTKAPGEVCDFADECAAPAGAEASCSFNFDTDSSVCVVDRRGSAGATCQGTCEVREAGSSCSYGGDFVTERTLCYTNDGLTCLDGACTARRADGETCRFSRDCNDGLFCDMAGSSVCRAKLANGSACEDDNACADGYCARETSLCTAFVALGGACDPSSFDSVCGPDASCGDGGTCESLAEGALGFACAMIADMVGG